MRMKINDLECLQSEKLRLKAQAHAYNQQIKEDVELLKEYYTPKRILLRTGMAALPDIVSALSALRSPLSLLTNKLFKSGTDKQKGETKGSQAESRNEESKSSGSHMKGIALGVAETVGTLLLNRYLRRKL